LQYRTDSRVPETEIQNEYFTITVVAVPDIKEPFRNVALTDLENRQVDRNENLGEIYREGGRDKD
jgi:alpha-D-ribose 1-methylphosphonate 5-phosphate C-P lyase